MWPPRDTGRKKLLSGYGIHIVNFNLLHALMTEICWIILLIYLIAGRTFASEYRMFKHQLCHKKIGEVIKRSTRQQKHKINTEKLSHDVLMKVKIPRYNTPDKVSFNQKKNFVFLYNYYIIIIIIFLNTRKNQDNMWCWLANRCKMHLKT